MKGFNAWVLEVPEAERENINAVAIDRDGTVKAFYSRDPVAVYQEWKSDQPFFVVGQVAPMLDDWNHSLVQRPEHPALAWVAGALAVTACAIGLGWRLIV